MNECCHHEHSCIHNVPIFSVLSKDEQDQILQTSITKTFLKGERIFSTVDSSANLWVVNTGKVKVSKLSHEGKEQVIRILQQGDFLGDLTLFSNKKMNSDAFALQKSEICIINGDRLKRIIHQNPDIAIKFLEVYSKRVQKAEEMIEQIGIYDIEQRIIKTLLDEVNHSSNNEFTLPFSKSDFASMIGTTRETLSRKLAKFQDHGWIELNGQRDIRILNKQMLQDILNR